MDGDGSDELLETLLSKSSVDSIGRSNDGIADSNSSTVSFEGSSVRRISVDVLEGSDVS